MTDQYEPVTAADLRPGDEVEVVFRGVYAKESYGFIPFMSTSPVPWLQSIRRKSRPISVGDRVAHRHGAEGQVLGIDGDYIWILYRANDYTTWKLSDLTRVTP
jgi:hypothetical protein